MITKISSERAQRVAVITALIKEAVHNPRAGDRNYLDELLEKYDPSYRASDERKTILLELSTDKNEILRKYAEAKLREVFPDAHETPRAPAEKAKLKD